MTGGAAARWLEGRAALHPARPALWFEGETISYAAFAALGRRIAGGLAARGVGRGDRVAWLGRNTPEMLAALFACARLGAIFAPLNWRLTAAEHRLQLAGIAPTLLAAEPEWAETAAAAGALGVASADPAALAAEAAATDDVGRPEDGLLLVHTSGATGRPKAALLTQAAATWTALHGQMMHDLRAEDRVLTTLPLFHVGGLNIQTLPALHAGAQVALHRRFDPETFFADVAALGITLAVLVPAQLQALLDHPGWAAADLASLRLVATGSQIVPPSLIGRWHARVPTVTQVYGATESGPIATWLPPELCRLKPGAAGRAAPHGRIRVVRPDGRPCAADEAGEVQIAGPQLFAGYWDDPAATAAAFDGAWLRTGDIGRIDTDGDLWIAARRGDLIISGGENVYPAEVEQALLEHPDIAEAAVFGVLDPRWGETPAALAVPRPGAAPDPAAVLATLVGRLARFKHPRRLRLVAALPRTALGKVERARLAALLEDDSIAE